MNKFHNSKNNGIPVIPLAQVGALRWADVVSVERVGTDGVKCSPTRSKLGDESRRPGEDLGDVVPRVEGTRFHISSCSRRWKDNWPVLRRVPQHLFSRSQSDIHLYTFAKKINK